MTIFGIGLLLMAAGGFSLALILLVEALWGVQLHWCESCSQLLIPLSAFLAAPGFFFWISSIMTIRKAFDEKKLLTNGVYGLTRNPMYAAFILFLIPSVSFLMNNPLIVLASGALYIVFRMKIHKEEAYLLEVFGDDYRWYAVRVPRLIPRLWGGRK